MTEYQRELAQILERCTEEMETALSHNDFSPYTYKETLDEKYGTCDGNYQNRLRVSMAMLFYAGDRTRLEKFVRRLFEEELKDRKTNAYQGTGYSLEILSILLLEYGCSEDKALLESAKQANFDCACGYEAGCPDYPRSVEECGIESCLDYALELGERESASRILELWKKEQQEWNERNLRTLRFWQKRLGQHDGELESLRQLAEQASKSEKKWDYCSALQNYLRKLVAVGHTEEAWHVITVLMRRMEESWFDVGLGRFVLEDVADFILLDPPEQQAGTAWEWVWARLGKMGKAHHNLYRKGAMAARKMNNEKAAIRLEKTLAKERKRLGLDK